MQGSFFVYTNCLLSLFSAFFDCYWELFDGLEMVPGCPSDQIM